jgi:hypothetical protein
VDRQREMGSPVLMSFALYDSNIHCQGPSIIEISSSTRLSLTLELDIIYFLNSLLLSDLSPMTLLKLSGQQIKIKIIEIKIMTER